MEDLMKVWDQTVRELKREVNLKLLKIPEIEQKVLDATSDEPWGPHGSDLSEIAQATKKYTECEMIMNVLWERLGNTSVNWRHIYKALAVIDYLVAHGSERAVNEIIDNISQIMALSRFECVELNGKDVGLNVRRKVESILSTLDDKDKLQQVREKAAATCDKYIGLSSYSIAYKSSGSSYSSSDYSTRETDSLRKSYDEKYSYKNSKTSQKPKEMVDNNDKSRSSKSKEGTSYIRKKESLKADTTKTFSSKSSSIEDDYNDDFDPRASSNFGTGNKSNNQMDLFGQSLMDDITSGTSTTEIDLFADSAFQSAATTNSQGNIDLFAGQSSEQNTSNSGKIVKEEPFDPFASIPLNSFESSNQSFGSFISNTGDKKTLDSSQNNNNNNNNNNKNKSKPDAKKGSFQVKSGIWADSLSRGLIDLNITAPPKKVSLSGIGIVGGLSDGSDNKEKMDTDSSPMYGPGLGPEQFGSFK